MKKTVLSHIYNEEYLLPLWLNHHKKHFDHGIIIDYNSTDHSVEIIREICPTWEVHTSKNRDFDARLCDAEIITPKSAFDSATRCAIAGVGNTPTRYTLIPALVKPATTAASRNSPDARES